MIQLIRHEKIVFDVSPEEVAKMFCEMDSEDQAKFFNAIAKEVKSWKYDFVFQLQHISDESCLTPEARTVMREIGEYAN